MSTAAWYEVIGLTGTLIIMMSYCYSDLKKIRSVNIGGSILFIIYGLLTHTWSTALLNFLCIVVNVYKMCKEGKKKPESTNTDSISFDFTLECVLKSEGFDDEDLSRLRDKCQQLEKMADQK